MLVVTTLSFLAAVPVVAAAAAIVPGAWSPGAVAAGVASGALALVGFLAFYAALAAGPISVLSPGIAVLQSIVPVVVGLTVGGERLGAAGAIGLVLAVVASPLLAIAPAADGAVAGGGVAGGGAAHGGLARGGRTGLRGVLLALVASAGLGVSTVLLDAAPADSGVVPILLEVVVGAIGLLVIVGVRWRRLRPGAPPDARPLVRPVVRPAVRDALVGGALLGVANALLMLALHAGELSVVAVLIGLYPVGTILLARAVLGERLSRVQLGGVALALVACVLLGLGG